MANFIRGISVTLYEQIEVCEDDFGATIYEENPIRVDNVLVLPTLGDDVINHLNLTGRKAVYTLAIPKGDTNNWINKKVEFFGETWRTFGEPVQGMEHQIPLDWNLKVQVERYE